MSLVTRCAFVVPGEPVPKPRQTQADRWKQRAPVVRYRQFADLLRLYAGRHQWREVEGMRYSLAVRFVLPFPKTASAQCLLTSAPSPIADAQLQELHIRVAKPKT